MSYEDMKISGWSRCWTSSVTGGRNIQRWIIHGLTLKGDYSMTLHIFSSCTIAKRSIYYIFLFLCEVFAGVMNLDSVWMEEEGNFSLTLCWGNFLTPRINDWLYLSFICAFSCAVLNHAPRPPIWQHDILVGFVDDKKIIEKIELHAHFLVSRKVKCRRGLSIFKAHNSVRFPFKKY